MIKPGANYHLRARYYDIEFKGSEDRKILSRLVASSGENVLEVPCGSGRNCQWLVGTNKKVVFMDIDQQMILQVRAKLRRFDHEERCRAVCGNMLNIETKSFFDLVLVPREAIQLLKREDLIKALANFRKCLAFGGILYLDVAQLDPALRAKNDLPKYIVEQDEISHIDLEVKNSGRFFQRWHTSRLADNALQVRFDYKIYEGKELTEFRSEFMLARYTYTEIAQACETRGFEIVRSYGGYDGTPYVGGKSSRIILILKKRL